MIRPLRPEDAAELAALLVENRDFLARFEPLRDEAFFTAEGNASGSRRTIPRRSRSCGTSGSPEP
jgi:[ribosomal protein S5]-alanine N-acetyltransferase